MIDPKAMRELLAAIRSRTTDEDARTAVAAAEDLLAELQKLLGHNADLATQNDALAFGLNNANARAARAKPVLDAVQAWRRWFPFPDSMFAPENALIAAVDAYRTCPDCGPGGCGGHTRKPSEAEPTRHTDPGEGPCPRCIELDAGPERNLCPDCGSNLGGSHGPTCVVTRLSVAFGSLAESPEQAQAAFEHLMARLKAEGASKAVERG